jgi:hypothetical protein
MGCYSKGREEKSGTGSEEEELRGEVDGILGENSPAIGPLVKY